MANKINHSITLVNVKKNKNNDTWKKIPYFFGLVFYYDILERILYMHGI